MVLLAGAVPAQTDKGDDSKKGHVDCKACGGQNRRDCPEHSKADLKLCREAVYCSICAECKKCGGTSWIDCQVCSAPEIEKQLEESRVDIRKWLEERRKSVDTFMKHPCNHGKSDHVDLVFELKPMKVGLNKLSTHELLHLYLQRIEDARALFLKSLEARATDIGERTQVYMWKDAQDQVIAAPKFSGMGASGVGVKLMGASQVYTMRPEKQEATDDEMLHRNVMHNVSHLFLANMTPSLWIGNQKGGWVDEGVAHWFEFTIGKRCTNRCTEEVASDMQLPKGGKMRSHTRRLVDSGKNPSFAQVCQKNTDQLTGDEHALAYSYVDFLITTYGGAKFKQMCTVLKEKKPAREALMAAYGLNPITIEPLWREYVIKNYPPMEPDQAR